MEQSEDNHNHQGSSSGHQEYLYQMLMAINPEAAISIKNTIVYPMVRRSSKS